MMHSTTPASRRPPGRVKVWFGTLAAVASKELILMRRYPVESLAGFAQVFLMITIFTLAALTFAPEGDRPSAANSIIAGVMVYGFLLFIFLTEALWSLGYSVRREQRQGTLEQLYLSPASKSAGLVSRACVTLLWTGLLAALSTWMMASMIGGLPIANLPLATVLLILTLTGTCGIGFAFAAVTLRAGEMAQTLATILQFGFMIFCAPFYPFSVLPRWMELVSRALPLSYCVDAFRSVLMGYPTGYPELAEMETEMTIVALFGILMPLIGLWIFKLEERNARRKGNLSGY